MPIAKSVSGPSRPLASTNGPSRRSTGSRGTPLSASRQPFSESLFRQPGDFALSVRVAEGSIGLPRYACKWRRADQGDFPKLQPDVGGLIAASLLNCHAYRLVQNVAALGRRFDLRRRRRQFREAPRIAKVDAIKPSVQIVPIGFLIELAHRRRKVRQISPRLVDRELALLYCAHEFVQHRALPFACVGCDQCRRFLECVAARCLFLHSLLFGLRGPSTHSLLGAPHGVCNGLQYMALCIWCDVPLGGVGANEGHIPTWKVIESALRCDAPGLYLGADEVEYARNPISWPAVGAHRGNYRAPDRVRVCGVLPLFRAAVGCRFRNSVHKISDNNAVAFDSYCNSKPCSVLGEFGYENLTYLEQFK